MRKTKVAVGNAADLSAAFRTLIESGRVFAHFAVPVRDNHFTVDVSRDGETYKGSDIYNLKMAPQIPRNHDVTCIFPHRADVKGNGSLLIAKVHMVKGFSSMARLNAQLNESFKALVDTTMIFLHLGNSYAIKGLDPQRHHVYVLWADRFRRVTQNAIEAHIEKHLPVVFVTNQHYGILAVFPLWEGIMNGDVHVLPKCLPVRQLRIYWPTNSVALTCDTPMPRGKDRALAIKQRHNQARGVVDAAMAAPTLTAEEEREMKDRSRQRSNGIVMIDDDDDDDDSSEASDDDEDDGILNQWEARHHHNQRKTLTQWENGDGYHSSDTSTEAAATHHDGHLEIHLEKDDDDDGDAQTPPWTPRSLSKYVPSDGLRGSATSTSSDSDVDDILGNMMMMDTKAVLPR